MNQVRKAHWNRNELNLKKKLESVYILIGLLQDEFFNTQVLSLLIIWKCTGCLRVEYTLL